MRYCYREIRDLLELTDFEKHRRERVRQNYFNLASHRSFSEEAVKMVVLSPLLNLAGFFQAPFGIQTEESVEITAEDEGVVISVSRCPFMLDPLLYPLNEKMS